MNKNELIWTNFLNKDKVNRILSTAVCNNGWFCAFFETFEFVESSVMADSLVLRNPLFRQAPNHLQKI